MTDQRHPWDAQAFADSFEESEEVQVPVDPDSPLGRAMAQARESWVQNGVPDPDDFKVVPIPVDLD